MGDPREADGSRWSRSIDTAREGPREPPGTQLLVEELGLMQAPRSHLFSHGAEVVLGSLLSLPPAVWPAGARRPESVRGSLLQEASSCRCWGLTWLQVSGEEGLPCASRGLGRSSLPCARVPTVWGSQRDSS